MFPQPKHYALGAVWGFWVCAQEGEQIQANWIFVLMAESLSDHIQWAIVDRSGLRETYNYGFN